MTIAAPLRLHRDEVRSDWIDVNGHMNVGYYSVVFDFATDAFFDYIGLDAAYRVATGGSTFTVETHLTYQQELREGAPLAFETRLLDFDAKRVHYISHMYHAEDRFLAATCECLSLHVDLATRRVSPLPEAIQERLAAVLEAHDALPRPAETGRAVGLRKAPRA